MAEKRWRRRAACGTWRKAVCRTTGAICGGYLGSGALHASLPGEGRCDCKAVKSKMFQLAVQRYGDVAVRSCGGVAVWQYEVMAVWRYKIVAVWRYERGVADCGCFSGRLRDCLESVC